MSHILDADNDGQGDYSPDTAADARQRALRTLLQGLAAALLVAIVAVLAQQFTAASSWADISPATLSFLIVQAIVTAAASFVTRYLAPPSS